MPAITAYLFGAAVADRHEVVEEASRDPINVVQNAAFDRLTSRLMAVI